MRGDSNINDDKRGSTSKHSCLVFPDEVDEKLEMKTTLDSLNFE